MRSFKRNGMFWAANFLVLSALGSAWADTLTDIRPLWTADLKTYTESGPSVADVDGDGVAEVIVAGREEIIVLKGDGKEVWRWTAKGRFMTYPSVLERTGNPALIFAADGSGTLTCLDGAGAVIWQAPLGATTSWSAAALADLNSDDTWEVVQTSEQGAVYAFDALTGRVVWQSKVDGAPANPAVGDLNGDGIAEVVLATTKGKVFALSAEGAPLWTYDLGGESQTWSTSSPVMFACRDGSRRIVAGSNEGEVVCLGSDGVLIWRRTVRGPVASGISVGDIDLDGAADVFVVTQLGVIYRFGEDGALLWEVDMQGRSLAAGALLDIEGDGALDYVLCTQQGRLLVLDGSARFKFDLQYDTRCINVTPAFGDIDPATPGLEMALTGGESGKTFCLATGAPIDTLRHWTAYGGNEHKTNAWFDLAAPSAPPKPRKAPEAAPPDPTPSAASADMRPEELSAERISAHTEVRFRIETQQPFEKPATALASCALPNGAHVVATSKVLGARGDLVLPVSALWPGSYRFEWSLTDTDGILLAKASQAIEADPFANDRALAEDALAALHDTAQAIGAASPLAAAALTRQAADLQDALAKVAALQEAHAAGGVAVEQSLVNETAALLSHSQRCHMVAEVVREATLSDANATLIAFEAQTWENRRVDEQLPESANLGSLAIARAMVPGEHEPVAIGLLNIIDRPVQARISAEILEGAPAINLHRSVPVVTSLGEKSWDPLPELDESGVLTLKPFSTTELWVDMDGTHAKPGIHESKLTIHALNGAGVIEQARSPQSVASPETVVHLSAVVLPFEMAPPGDFRLCAWASLNGAAIDDLLAHGNNVFIVPHGKPAYDDAGTVTGADFAAMDDTLQRLRGHDVMLLVNGMPALRGGMDSPEYAAGLAPYLRLLADHLAGFGFDRDHFALYPIDEPGGHGWDTVNQLVTFGKLVRNANPEVMLYVDGGGELPMFEAMAPVIDIWCPGIDMLPYDTPEMRVMRGNGGALWSYDCAYTYSRPIGPNIKNINIVGQFRTAALFAMRHNATGIGYWSYNIGDDMWGRVQMEYPLVYPGRAKPVTSRRWEAVREGIEDYRILAALRNRLETTENAEARQVIQQLLEVTLPAMIDRAYTGVRLGSARYVLDAANNDNTIGDFRQAMVLCIKDLGEETEDEAPL